MGTFCSCRKPWNRIIGCELPREGLWFHQGSHCLGVFCIRFVWITHHPRTYFITIRKKCVFLDCVHFLSLGLFLLWHMLTSTEIFNISVKKFSKEHSQGHVDYLWSPWGISFRKQGYIRLNKYILVSCYIFRDGNREMLTSWLKFVSLSSEISNKLLLLYIKLSCLPSLNIHI